MSVSVRRWLLALVPAAVLAGTLLGGLPAQAAPAHTAQATSCVVYVHDQVLVGGSKVWISSYPGCSRPVFYNRTECTYRYVIGAFWYDGPTRYGSGSSTSNYSGVTCNQYPWPVVAQVWIWFNVGSGWTGHRLF